MIRSKTKYTITKKNLYLDFRYIFIDDALILAFFVIPDHIIFAVRFVRFV